ncbi:Tag1p KNAG_0I01410 [Huiozyma naganishii CBS 8797]|uniref:Uncharacterized protein n=1 Tax=Huiozyma naganishii (strain ATCC MYA-139 / BCRC 22969 / CBS 8797 / KCTC 17520 / NBRC 10181 / NCYC 3082 / Yp74L-3) TaxID=1071383 RepID=J7RAM6_HUIN7|nr:hypothetical protein KNAG_0I01410 [Kazachstania naganishii CBS 8797]CCK71930.1 hypothetical protein KNAG_0I01410 [Kazachstania naganishii CBS 8797]
METHPLLSPSNSNEVQQGSFAQGVATRKKRGSKYWPFWLGIFTGLCTILVVVGVSFSLQSRIPSEKALQSNVVEITNVDIEKVTLDGWRVPGKEGLDTEGGKFLQISARVNVFLNYDALNESKVQMTFEQQKWFKWTSENTVRTLCIDVNNATTFGRKPDGKDDVLAGVYIQHPVCIDLHNGTVTSLNVTILVEPHMKNVLKIIKKIWKQDYQDLNLWSTLDISLSKNVGSLGYLHLFRLPNIKINWNDIIDWDKLSNRLQYFRDQIENDINVSNIRMVDTEKGFDVRMGVDPMENPLWHFLDDFSWLEIPQAVIPPLSWVYKVADCFGDFSINLTHLLTHSSAVDIGAKKISPSMSNSLTGPLPDDFLYQVCWSDEENTVTPLTKVLNSLFNSSNYLTVEAKAEISNSKPTTSDETALIPSDILSSILEDVSYFPVKQNVTFNMSSLIDEFFIDGMSLRWSNGRVSLGGTLVGIFDLSFYETNEERIHITHIKGNMELYHNDRHFITVPMKVWSNATSNIMHDEDNKNATMLELTFDIDDEFVQVTNRMELTKCFNEIFFSGETLITFSNDLDIVVESFLGDIVVTGLKTEGETVVH